MNKWQQYYTKTFLDGMPAIDEWAKHDLYLLGKIGDSITVRFPAMGNLPARAETYRITEECDDMPNGVISVVTLVSNLSLWEERNYKIEY